MDKVLNNNETVIRSFPSLTVFINIKKSFRIFAAIFFWKFRLKWTKCSSTPKSLYSALKKKIINFKFFILNELERHIW